jgi:outer membrane murein-binding lipoprotein Lpp
VRITFVILSAAALAGCVSLGYHERALHNARLEELRKAVRWVSADRADLLEARLRLVEKKP